MSLSHLYRGDADRSASVEPAWRLQHTKWIFCIIAGNVCTVWTFPVITQKIYFKSCIPQILLTSQAWRRSNIAFVANTLQMCCRIKWNSKISFIGNFFSVKRPNEFLRPTNLSWGQKKSKRPTKFF